MKKISDLKIAIVHEYLNFLGGAERVLLALLEAFPQSDVFLLTYSPSKMPRFFLERLSKHKVSVSFLKYFQKFTPLVRLFAPLATESLDLKGYDLIFSNCNSYGKGVIAPQDSLHISYIHSPTRYLWDYAHNYLKEHTYNFFSRLLLEKLFLSQRKWDFLASRRPDLILANSENVKERIKKYYHRDSIVLYPPVRVSSFRVNYSKKDFFLVVSRLSPYKKIDLVVRVFKNLPTQKLKIAGGGSDEKRLRKIAGDSKNIEFLGFVSDKQLKKLYSEAQAVIFPQVEDFGLVPIEAAASGTPTIAYKKGGALETIIDGETGLFFKRQDEKSLKYAIENFIEIKDRFKPSVLRKHSKNFDIEKFKEKLVKIIEDSINKN